MSGTGPADADGATWGWTCEETRDAAAEFALKILPRSQRRLAAAHLLGCDACRREVEAFSDIATRLLDLVPGTEPPLGFDHAVLARVTPQPRRARTVAVAIVAAVIICLIAAGSAVYLTGGSGRPGVRPGVKAAFRAGGAPVGTFSAAGRPLWVSVVIRGLPLSGPVACQLVGRNGTVQTLGRFDLVEGAGSWAAPYPPGIGRDQEARLVDRAGRLIAVATWSSPGAPSQSTVSGTLTRTLPPGGAAWGVAGHRWFDMLA